MIAAPWTCSEKTSWKASLRPSKLMSSARVRTVRLPPADLANAKIPAKKERPRLWYRVHQSKFDAIHFSLRDVHRFSHPQCPYSCLYLACDIATCLFERFGD